MLYKIVNGAVTLGNKTILEEINFEVKNQEHVAIVGRNGCGKTTLLRAIIGELELEQGISEEDFVVTKLGNFNIGYVRQNAIIEDNITLLEEILKAYQNILKIEKQLEKMTFELENHYDEKLVNKYQDLYLHYQTIGGYDYQKEYETALRKFGFQESDKFKKLCEFSYGQRTKIAFLKLILSKPDLLLLDEPTNHLDILAIEWLERYLANYSKALVIISHDRMFLDKICNVVYEIDYGSMKRYSGNYSYYLKQRELDYEKDRKDFSRQQKEIERLTRIADRFRYKPSKASMALSKLKQIERMVKLEKPKEYNMRTFSGEFVPRIDSYRDVLKVKELKFGYKEALGEVSFQLERGDRLGIIGENGTGKSTLLKTLMGEISTIGGKYVFGNRVEIGYFDQNIESLNRDSTVLDIMRDEFPMIGVEELRSILGTFEFSGDMVFQTVDSLSGGQKVKLLLCKIMKHQPNVLILDEPTNHLDIVGKEAIEQLLLRYRGTIIFVSHDRYFVQKIATCLLVFEKERISFYKGDYSYYLKIKEKEVDNEVENDYVYEKKVRDKKKYASTFKERSKLEKKLKKLEDEIENLEKEVKNFQQELLKQDVYMDLKKASDVSESLENIESILHYKMEEWEEICSLLEK